jgi:hypothetical protein
VDFVRWLVDLHFIFGAPHENVVLRTGRKGEDMVCLHPLHLNSYFHSISNEWEDVIYISYEEVF